MTTNSTDEQPDWTNPQFCPYCGSENLVDNDEWEQRDDDEHETELDIQQGFRLHGINICSDCGGRFETVSEPRTYRNQYETWTFQFVPEDLEDSQSETVADLEAIRLIEANEDAASVKAERAKWNLMFGGCSEVQGPSFAIEALYEFAEQHTKIQSEEKEFEAGRWLADMDNANSSNDI